MIRGALVLVFSGLAWCAALWLLIAPEFSRWSPPELIGAHALPPLLVWSGWLLVRRRRAAKEAVAAAERERLAETERQAAQEAARQAQEEERQRQQYGCDCRAVAMAQVGLTAGTPPGLGLEAVNVMISESREEAEPSAGDSILDYLDVGIREALGGIYASCPAAVHFPVYVLPPSEVAGEEVFQRLRGIRGVLLAELGLSGGTVQENGPVYFLPGADSIANSVISLFETAPDLPGAVVLAFDSPRLRISRLEDYGDDADPRRQERERWIGKPSQGIFALLLTNRELESMLAALEGRAVGEYDALTPYWEKDALPGGNQALLARMSPQEREVLAAAPVLGRIHRAVFAQLERQRNRCMEMVRALLPLLERARINAGLVASAPNDNGEADGEADGTNECGWLVHNAGGVDCSGNRVASLGVALIRQGIDLDPIDAGTNVVVQIGDLGHAHSAGMLALTVAKAAANGAAALCAEYSGDEGLALYFAAPVGAAA